MKHGLTLAALALACAAPANAAVFSFTSGPVEIADAAETDVAFAVSGVTGPITDVTVSLNGFYHTYPDDLVFGLLNESAGIGFVFMSGVGGSGDVSGINLLFSDSASQFLPESFVDSFPITSGTYLPSNFLDYEFSFYDNATSFAGFAGLDANTGWTIVIADTFAADTGGLINGITLNFYTADTAVPEPATWAMMIAGFGMVGGALRRRKPEVRLSYSA